MNKVYLYNTKTKKKEELKPIKEGHIGIYSYGPTVYWNQHIGNIYAYIQWDTLVRFLKYIGYKVTWVMNITDVGHLTSDEDIGEDKIEKGARRENLTVWEIADKYISQFKESLRKLNIDEPNILCRATEHINEQIKLVKKIEANGYTYKTSTGLVFDTSKVENYAEFANLSLEDQKAGFRVEVDPEKKNPWDFLLWITNQPNHIMKWNSPWGVGFPGWHIECTAMSVKYLGEHFDIHTGGIEHISVHHTNEIAQACGAFGHETANYWLHNAWLLIENEKVSKSLGNTILVDNIGEKGIDPLALRYLAYSSHYRKGLNFTWDSLKAAETALNKLRTFISTPENNPIEGTLEAQNEAKRGYEALFIKDLSDDLNLPKAVSVLWEVVKDGKLSHKSKKELILGFDKVLGLNLEKAINTENTLNVSSSLQNLINLRVSLKKEGKYSEADKVRKGIEEEGYRILDTRDGTKLEKI